MNLQVDQSLVSCRENISRPWRQDIALFPQPGVFVFQLTGPLGFSHQGG